VALQNAGIPVAFDFVLPAGAYAESVEPVRDFDASKPGTAGVQARDKLTGHPLWTVNVYDPDPQARTKAIKVKIASPVQPVLPEAVGGMPFRPVEFDGMTITPYVAEGAGRPRVAYSIRARAMRAPAPGGRPAPKGAAAQS
jgi:hypothetical protein